MTIIRLKRSAKDKGSRTYLDRAVQASDIPHPDLIGNHCTMGGDLTGLAFCSSASVLLNGIFSEDLIDGGFGCEIDPWSASKARFRMVLSFFSQDQ